MPLIETRALRRHYGDLVALRDLDLAIDEGDVFALVGPNGAGKTTLLRMLAGLMLPTAGQILWRGKPHQPEGPEWLRQIGFLPDYFGLYEDLRVWEYLDYFAACYELPAERRPGRVNEAIELVNLMVKRDAHIGELSRGMKQRVGIAKTLLHDPALLLLDEPAAGLDPLARIELSELIKQLQRQGKTILISSHILTELADFCNAFGLLEKGTMVKSGKIADLAARKAERLFALDTLDPPELVHALLQATPGLVLRETRDHTASFTFAGDDAAVAALIQQLVAGGIRLIGFQEKKIGLQEIFMEYSSHEVM